MSAAEAERAFRFVDIDSPSDRLSRPALVACLTSEATKDDLPLLRIATRSETEWVQHKNDGCGDTLLACCWLLFKFGDVEDSVAIYEAKMCNFDAGCYIDSVFLVGAGLPETTAFAKAAGLTKLAEWIAPMNPDDVEYDAANWRDSTFFARRPPLNSSVEDLAAWIRGE